MAKETEPNRLAVKVVEPDTLWRVRRDLMAVQREQRLQWVAICGLTLWAGSQALRRT